MLKHLKLTLFIPTLALNACATNITPLALKCPYSSTITNSLTLPEGFTILNEFDGIDSDSQEKTRTHSILLSNGDKAFLKQKYCTMYNFEINYKIKVLNQDNFQLSLNNISKLITSVNQDYTLKTPLPMVVDMEMNRHQYSIDAEFHIGLPKAAAQSSQHIQHSINYQYNKYDDFHASIGFEFSIESE